MPVTTQTLNPDIPNAETPTDAPPDLDRHAETMNAIVRARYGGPEVLEYREVPRPTTGDTDVLVRVHAAAVCGDDWHLMRGLPYVARLEGGLFTPSRRTLGLDVAGTVEAVGPGVTRFAPGDAVFGWCEGSFAEWVSVPEVGLAAKPSGVTFAEASAVPVSAVTALGALRTGGVGPGTRVLVNGASGGVGGFAVQIAKAFGAHVTGVCSAANVELVLELGADVVVDYTTESIADHTERYDVIIDLAQSHSLGVTRKALRPGGTLVMVGSAARGDLRGRNRWFKGTDRWIAGLLLSPFVGQRLRPFVSVTARTPENLETLRELLATGRLRVVIDRLYPLHEAGAAIEHTERGRPHGKVVVTVHDGPDGDVERAS